MSKQRRFTLTELLSRIISLASLGVAGVILYAEWHFISKYW